MLDSTKFFQSPALSICDVMEQDMQVFMSAAPMFLMLSFLQSVSFIGLWIVLIIIFSVLFYSQMAVLLTMAGADDNNSGTRALMEWSRRYLVDGSFNGDNSNYPGYDVQEQAGSLAGFGSSSSSGSFSGLTGTTTATNNVNLDALDAIGEFSIAVIIEFALIFMIALFSVMVVYSTFSGAFIRATAEIYAGQSTPSLSACLKHGWKKFCKIVCFQALICLAMVCVIAVFSMIGGILMVADQEPVSLFLGIFILYASLLVLFIMLSSGMVAAKSSIVVQGTTPVGAIRASWALCKDSLCFIFVTLLCFIVTEILVRLVINFLFVSSSNGFITFIGVIASFVVGLAITPINMILESVLYFSFRIRKEGLTQSILLQEIGGEEQRGFELHDTTSAPKYAIASIIEEEEQHESGMVDGKKAAPYRDFSDKA